MVKIKGADINPEKVAPRCAAKYLKPVAKLSNIDLERIGDRKNNILLDLLRCQVKVEKSCKPRQRSYELCHASVMGTGNFEGRKDCGKELESLFQCAL
jgi:hypothetical protein